MKINDFVMDLRLKQAGFLLMPDPEPASQISSRFFRRKEVERSSSGSSHGSSGTSHTSGYASGELSRHVELEEASQSGPVLVTGGLTFTKGERAVVNSQVRCARNCSDFCCSSYAAMLATNDFYRLIGHREMQTFLLTVET